MASNKCKYGCATGVPSKLSFQDKRTGSNRTVSTSAQLVGNRPMMQDKRGMNQMKLNVPNPLNGKK